MRRLLSILVVLVAASASAQQATVTTPVVPSEAKIVVTKLDVARDCSCASVEVAFQDANSLDSRRVTFSIPADPTNPGTEMQTFMTALITVRATETGGASRKLNFRILGYLSDAGRIGGVTLQP